MLFNKKYIFKWHHFKHQNIANLASTITNHPTPGKKKYWSK